MRSIKFSTLFPSYHSEKGNHTHFVQKILHSLVMDQGLKPVTQIGNPPKHHTIRVGNRWKPGDKFAAQYWKGRPYWTSPETFAEITIEKVWSFEFTHGYFKINEVVYDGEIESHHELLERIATNDGLEISDFKEWFFKSPGFKKNGSKFTGQIICWNPDIEY